MTRQSYNLKIIGVLSFFVWKTRYKNKFLPHFSYQNTLFAWPNVENKLFMENLFKNQNNCKLTFLLKDLEYVLYVIVCTLPHKWPYTLVWKSPHPGYSYYTLVWKSPHPSYSYLWVAVPLHNQPQRSATETEPVC